MKLGNSPTKRFLQKKKQIHNEHFQESKLVNATILLACAIDCGLDWIVQEMPLLLKTLCSELELPYGPTVMDLFNDKELRSDMQSSRFELATDWFLGALQDRHRKLEMAQGARACCLNFLGFITDVRSWICLLTSTRIPLGSNNVLSALTSNDNIGYTVAIPLCLNEVRFSLSTGLWLLKEHED